MDAPTPVKKKTKKRSYTAKSVAREVGRRIRNGTRVNLYEILKAHGYSDRVAKHPRTVTGTLSFQEEIDPIIAPMKAARDFAIAGILAQKKRFPYMKIGELSSVVKVMTHDSRLLEGKETERLGLGKELTKLGAVLKKIKA